MSLDQASVATKAPAWADAKIAEFAPNATVTQLRRALRDDAFDDGTDPPPTARHDRDRVTFGPTGNGRWRLNADLDLAAGERITAALTERRDALFTDDPDVTWADALADIAERSLDTIESSERRDRYRTWIHLSAGNGEATTTAGWCLPPELRDRLLCDGAIQPVWERDGLPISVGRSARIVPDRTRRIIEHRDRGCRVPGCSAERFVEIHHIIHWLHGGTTDTFNLVSLCPKHHRLHHQGLLGIAGNADHPDGLTFTTQHGLTLDPTGTPTLPVRPPPRPPQPYRHPPGERINYDWITWVHPDELARRRERARRTPPTP